MRAGQKRACRMLSIGGDGGRGVAGGGAGGGVSTGTVLCTTRCLARDLADGKEREHLVHG